MVKAKVQNMGKGFQGWVSQASPDVLYDRQLVWLAFSLMLTGLVMVTSASFPISTRLTGEPFHFMVRHGIFLFLALCAATVVVQIPLERWMKHSMHLLLFSMFYC